jgi:hypothetical protein
MAVRLVDLYPVGEPVEIVLDEQWAAGRVVGHEYPAVWVQTTNGACWFVTNGRRIRKYEERKEGGEVRGEG